MSQLYFPDSEGATSGLMVFAGKDADDGLFEIIATEDNEDGEWRQVDMHGDGYYLTREETIALRDFLTAAIEESENVELD